MPTLDWLNRQSAFTTSARVPYRLLAQVSTHSATPVPLESVSLVSVRPLKALLPFYRGQVDGVGMSGQLDRLLG